MAAERRFHAMGSDAHLIVVGGPPRLIDVAAARIDDLERRWSRFLPDSEVSQLNRWAGIPVAVSPETVTLVEHALAAWRLSAGAFDPTVLGAVIRAGYDRSFEQLGSTRRASHSPLGLGVEAIEIRGETVTLPAKTGFDPGGIGKGLAADIVCAEMIEAGAAGICVNLGGDVRVAGQGPEGGCWTVAVEHPEVEDAIARLGLADGAVATSTTLRRQWRVDGEKRHHLIDPQTGLPSDSDLALATVVAGQAWLAEVLAKAVLLAGSTHPFDIVEGTGAQALAIDHRGEVYATEGLAAYMGGVPVPTSFRHLRGNVVGSTAKMK
jgi:thiamine biosynthesis lipoprotein